MKDVLDRARAIAREKGHARVGAAHVLLALLDDPLVLARVNERAYSRVRLERILRAELAGEADETTYRHAPAPALEAALERAINDVRKPGLLFWRRADAADVFEALIVRRGLASEIAFDDESVRRLYDAIRRVVGSMSVGRPLIDHAFLALAGEGADDGRFARALEAIGCFPSEVYEALDQQLRSMGFRESLPLLPSHKRIRSVARGDAFVAQAAARANEAGLETLDLSLLIIGFLESTYARSCFSRLGISRDDLLRAYVGTSAVTKARPEGAIAEVVFHNDDITEQRVVLAVLEGHFGKSSAEAREFMLRAHHEGSASFFVSDAEAAAQQIEAALTDCAELGMPLRIELRAIPVGAKEEGGSPSF